MVQGQFKDSSSLFWILFCFLSYWLGFKELKSFNSEEEKLNEELFAIVQKALLWERVTCWPPRPPEM